MGEWGRLGACLKALADEKGAEFLKRETWATYQELEKHADVDSRLARLLLGIAGAWRRGMFCLGERIGEHHLLVLGDGGSGGGR